MLTKRKKWKKKETRMSTRTAERWITRSDRYTYGICNTRIITYTYNMYIMYRIQGYIARTVNHDQKVPKHWREIENERGKEKQMLCQLHTSFKVYGSSCRLVVTTETISSTVIPRLSWTSINLCTRCQGLFLFLAII